MGRPQRWVPSSQADNVRNEGWSGVIYAHTKVSWLFLSSFRASLRWANASLKCFAELHLLASPRRSFKVDMAVSYDMNMTRD